jgi:hypothetical protein
LDNKKDFKEIKYIENLNNEISVGKNCYIPRAYLKRMVTNVVYRVTFNSNNTNKSKEFKIFTMSEHAKYKNEIQKNPSYIKTDIITYMTSMWKATLFFSKIGAFDKPIMFSISLSDLVKNEINNPRKVLESMQALNLINFIETRDIYLIRIKNIFKNEYDSVVYNYQYSTNSIYIDQYFESEDFFRLETGIQKLMIYFQCKRDGIKLKKNNFFERKEVMSKLNISNNSRFDKFFNRAMNLLQIDKIIHKTIGRKNHRKVITRYVYELRVSI